MKYEENMYLFYMIQDRCLILVNGHSFVQALSDLDLENNSYFGKSFCAIIHVAVALSSVF